MPSICTKPLTAGDVIFESKPLIHVLDLQYKTKYCDNCFERSDQLKRCSKCLQMYYCDKSCQTMDWKYHKNECKIFRSKAFDPNLCSYEERLFLRLWFCTKSDQTFATKTHQLSDGSDVCLNDIQIKVEDLVKKQEFLVCFEIFFENFRSYGLDFDRKELFKCFHIFAANCLIFTPIAICGKTAQYLPIGFGLYLQLSHISHSCIPNTAVVNTKGLSLQLRAMKSIGFGEELTISYIDLQQNRTQRQTKLKTRFMIDCNCDKCLQNLDSKVDYKLIHYFNQQLYQNKPLVTKREDMFELLSKLMSFDNTIYVEYDPQKTIRMFSYLFIFIQNDYPNEEFIRHLTTKTEHSIRVTHGESHVLNDLFYQFLKN